MLATQPPNNLPVRPPLPVRRVQRYGWLPDRPDQRDLTFALPRAQVAALPPFVPTIGLGVPIYDQGQLGSCTANAIAAAINILSTKENFGPLFPSRLFIYYNERLMEGTPTSDSGAFIRDGIKSCAKAGVPPELMWPYNPTRFASPPPPAAYAEALHHLVTSYSRIPPSNLIAMKASLAVGLPFVFGFTVYESFESPATAQTGAVQLPTPSEQVVGGHAVLAVGYDDAAERFVVRNSWGAKWGLPSTPGHFTMPYAYLLNPQLASDFWVLRLLEPSPPATPTSQAT